MKNFHIIRMVSFTCSISSCWNGSCSSSDLFLYEYIQFHFAISNHYLFMLQSGILVHSSNQVSFAADIPVHKVQY
jgi:hypothetical protein